MNDTEWTLYRALYFYKKTRDGQSYEDVLTALNNCISENCNAWLAARVMGIEGHEVVRPGVIKDEDGLSYYILSANEEDMAQMEDQGLTKLHVNLRAVMKSARQEQSIVGLCLNPWDGGCFIKLDEIV